MPVASSTANATMLFESWLAAMSNLPEGWTAKLRGVLPSVET
jgi:hypothetical protein